MPGVRVITDSSCDLPTDLISKHGIEIVPLTIRFGADEFVDLRDLSPEDFWEKCRGFPSLPETAAPAPGAFGEAFRRAADDGADGVVCVTISSGLSATYQSAVTAIQSDKPPVPVDIVDSRFVTLAQGFVVLAATEAASSGASLDEVSARARESIPRIGAYATIDTLENLRKGGRIGGAQALVGSILSIKPVITLVDGVVELHSRQRTRSKALAHLVEMTRSRGEPDLLGISHGDASDVKVFAGQVASAFPGVEIVVSQMGAVIGTHVGQGGLAFVSRTRS